MEIDRNKLQEFIYDPTKIQHYVLTELEKEGYNITSSGSPFMFALEAAITTASNSIAEANNIIRKKYPNLASKYDHLYHHVTDEQLVNAFYYPSEALITFYVNIIDIRQSGYAPEGANYKETIIPEGSTIEVLGVMFTLLNDIIVRLYNNGSVYVEQVINDNEIAYSDVSILEATTYSTADTTPWIMFKTMVKQVKKTTVDIAVIPSEGFQKTLTMQDNYYYSTISYKNALTLDKYVKLNKSHTDEYIDINNPTIFISLYNKDVMFKLPDPYVVSNLVTGTVQISLYETKGKIYLPINKYVVDDFILTLNNTGKSASAATSTNINIRCNSDWVIDSGSNGLTLEEFRSNIINNTTGTINLPITDKQLDRLGKLQGYNIFKLEDVITGRVYLAMKSTPAYDSELVQCKQDVYFGTVTMVLEDVENNNFVNIGIDTTLVKAGAVFRNINGFTRLATNEEMEYIKNLRPIALINYLTTNKYFYCPFYYIIFHDESFAYTKIFNLDTPMINNVRILSKNDTIIQKSNIFQFGIEKYDYGYRLAVTLLTNPEFKELDITKVYLQLKIELTNGDYVFYNSKYDSDNEAYIFDIPTNFNITKNDELLITGGISETYTKYTSLFNRAFIYTITTDDIVQDPTRYLQTEIHVPNANRTHVVITKEQIEITFGNLLNSLYNKLYNSYSSRKFKTYKEDIYETYAEDVYGPDPKTGYAFRCEMKGSEDEELEMEDLTNTEGKQYRLVYNKTHNKGDYVLDPSGNKVIKHKAGEMILDESGNPIVDRMGGVVRYIDMLLMEYEFRASTSNAYKQYVNMTIDTIKTYTLVELPNVNNKLLDNTSILYKSYKTLDNIQVLVNGQPTVIPYLVVPHVTLYLKNVTQVAPEVMDNYITVIGNVINKHLDNLTIRLEDIKQDIKVAIGETVVGVKLSGLDPNDSEIVVIRDKLKRLSINKKLALNKNNDIVVKYDIKLDVQFLTDLD